MSRILSAWAPAIVGLLHVALVGYIVYVMLITNEPAWPMYWMLAFLVDVPWGVFWLLLVFKDYIDDKRPSFGYHPEPPSPSFAQALRALPVYAWLALSLVGLTAVLFLLVRFGAPLGRAADGPNFLFPLAVFGGLGTFLWANGVFRLLRMLLPGASEHAPHHLAPR